MPNYQTPRLPYIYLAGPMSGLPENNHPEFVAAATALREMGCFVFNPAEQNPVPTTYRQAMAVDLAWIMNYAEAIVLLPNFEKSKGTRIEVDLALALEIPILLYADALVAFAPAVAVNDNLAQQPKPSDDGVTGD